MPLPAGHLSRGTFDFHGTPVGIRSLSRKEAFELKGMELDAAEAFILARGTDSSAEEVDAFRAAEGDSGAINNLILAIGKLSGIKLEVAETPDAPLPG